MRIIVKAIKQSINHYNRQSPKTVKSPQFIRQLTVSQI